MLAGVEALDELIDGAGLVAARLVLGDKLKIHDGYYSWKKAKAGRISAGTIVIALTESAAHLR